MVYDLRKDYLAEGFSAEAAAEFDSEETVALLEAAIRANGFKVDRIGHGRHLVKRLAGGSRWDLVFNVAEGVHG
ncbi:MAG: D-alanine--D-alanine ligase, partial [Verrucomicrobia bacterium]|nr:D-alanine--D-alanine ligase [Verrucomicrobiota bacterium]